LKDAAPLHGIKFLPQISQICTDLISGFAQNQKIKENFLNAAPLQSTGFFATDFHRFAQI
jgi:hypothetical protein